MRNAKSCDPFEAGDLGDYAIAEQICWPVACLEQYSALVSR